MAFGSFGGRSLKVYLQGDTTDFEKALKRTEVRLKNFNDKAGGSALRGAGVGTGTLGIAGRAGVAAGIGAGIGILSKQAFEATQAASDLNEQISKTNVVFGSSAESIKAWSVDLDVSFGLSQRAALEAAGTFGSLFRNTGQTEANAARMSQTVTQLAADLASFNNTSVDDALNALRSGLSGEIEPLRRFQVFLTEAAVAQRALSDTGKRSVTELTQGERVLARYALILDQTSRAQGDFARTSGGLANQQRILRARVENLQTSIGSGLVPVLTEMVTQLNLAVGATSELGSALQRLNFDIPGGGSLGGALKDSLFLLPNTLQSAFGSNSKGAPDQDWTKRAAEAWSQQFGLGALQAAGKTAAKPTMGFQTGPASPLITQMSAGLDAQLARAQRTDGTKDDLDVLGKMKKFLEGALGDLRLNPSERAGLEQSLTGVVGQIKGIYDDQKRAAEDARAEAKRKADETRRKQREALQKAADAAKDFANGIKDAALDMLGSRQAKIDFQRGIADAKEQMRKAKLVGDPFAIRDASRAMQDAQMDRQRWLIENAKTKPVDGRTAQFTINNLVVQANNPRELIDALAKTAKRNTVQSRGKSPSTLIH